MSKHLERLRAMTAPDQKTWDLSPNDVAAIRWAIDEIAHLRGRLRATAQTIIAESADVLERPLRRLFSNVSNPPARHREFGGVFGGG